MADGSIVLEVDLEESDAAKRLRKLKQDVEDLKKSGEKGEIIPDVKEKSVSRIKQITEALGKAKEKAKALTSALTLSFAAGAVLILSKAFGTVLQNNAEFMAALSRLKGVMIDAFAPIADFIVPWLTALINVVSRAVAIINSLVGALFGVSAGANGAAAALKKQAGAGGSAAKSMAKFDEVNKLQDSGGGGGGGIAASGFDLESEISEYEEILGKALLVIGAILAFSGVNIPLGITLMAIGALEIASAKGADWDKIKRFISENKDAIFDILAAAALVLGAILTFSGVNIPLGIALMVSGAARLATRAALNWGKIVEFISKNKETIGRIMAVGGVAMLVLGVILTAAGVLPLGIGLIVAGAASLATAAALNWGAITRYVQANKDNITAIAAIGGMALLILGIMLTVAGFLPIGIALIVAGAGSLAAAVALNWDAIRDKVKDTWESVKKFWDEHIKPVFTKDWWAEKFNSIKEGMRAAMNGVLGIVESAINWIVDKMNTINWKIPDYIPGVGGSTFGFNLPRVSIPRLAAGAVIPPNREFLAMLGDQKSGVNIETPLETMVQAFRQALSEGGSGRDITVIMQLDRQEFGRAVYRANNDEVQRVGVRLAGGVL